MTSLMPPVLLVEDNPMDVDLTRRAFARRDLAVPVSVARDGAEAVGLLTAWPADIAVPALILLDLKLPKVDGLEVLRQFKAHPIFGAIPIVVLTTSKEDADINTAYRLGANSYIVKPVDFDRFTEVAALIVQYWLVLNTRPRQV